MENVDDIVKEHYGVGDLATRILDGLKATGVDLDGLTTEDLAVVDEFHIGGRMATQYAISKLHLSGNEHILDIGCGIGGAARTIASQTRNRVTGIDLTPEFIEVAEMLTRLTGLDDKAAFHAANALSMPFDDETFDAALTLHVAMNIRDRDALYGEIARVMKPAALLCIYDVIKKGDAPITFPMPWAQTEYSSHLVGVEEMQTLLERAGFEVDVIEDRTPSAIDFFNRGLAAAAKGPQPLGVHLIMGPTMREKLQNVKHNMEEGRIAPVLMTARRKTG